MVNFFNFFVCVCVCVLGYFPSFVPSSFPFLPLFYFTHIFSTISIPNTSIDSIIFFRLIDMFTSPHP